MAMNQISTNTQLQNLILLKPIEVPTPTTPGNQVMLTNHFQVVLRLHPDVTGYFLEVCYHTDKYVTRLASGSATRDQVGAVALQLLQQGDSWLQDREQAYSKMWSTRTFYLRSLQHKNQEWEIFVSQPEQLLLLLREYWLEFRWYKTGYFILMETDERLPINIDKLLASCGLRYQERPVLILDMPTTTYLLMH